MKISSQAFNHNEKIPSKYTGEGDDLSPPLQFEGVPNTAKSLALIVDDPDAPMGTFDHWIAWNIPVSQTILQEGAAVPNQGTNHFGELRYRGPLPPQGHGPHRYFFKAYALDTKLDAKDGITKEQLESAMEGHILEQAEVIGTYERK